MLKSLSFLVILSYIPLCGEIMIPSNSLLSSLDHNFPYPKGNCPTSQFSDQADTHLFLELISMAGKRRVESSVWEGVLEARVKAGFPSSGLLALISFEVYQRLLWLPPTPISSPAVQFPYDISLRAGIGSKFPSPCLMSYQLWELERTT